MTTLREVRTTIADLLAEKIPGLNTYRTAVDSVNSPAAVIAPDNPGADYTQNMRMKSVLWIIKVTVLVAWNDPENSQDDLDEYLDPTGDRSIPRALYNARHELQFTAVVDQMTAYGARYTIGTQEYVGAVLRVRVHAEGS